MTADELVAELEGHYGMRAAEVVDRPATKQVRFLAPSGFELFSVHIRNDEAAGVAPAWRVEGVSTMNWAELTYLGQLGKKG